MKKSKCEECENGRWYDASHGCTRQCKACDGTGEKKPEKENCQECEGEGRVYLGIDVGRRCTSCGGTGKKKQ